MHLPRRNATISKQFMDKEEECKNSWTRRNAKIHGQGGKKNFLVTIHNLSPHSVISINFSPAVITCSMRNLAILSRTYASNDLSRGCSSSPKLWI
jgi:hypothetical protein